MKTITIKEETKIPGTDYVLEAGDRIQIQEALSEFVKSVKTYTGTYTDIEAMVEFVIGVDRFVDERTKEQILDYMIG